MTLLLSHLFQECTALSLDTFFQSSSFNDVLELRAVHHCRLHQQYVQCEDKTPARLRTLEGWALWERLRLIPSICMCPCWQAPTERQRRGINPVILVARRAHSKERKGPQRPPVGKRRMRFGWQVHTRLNRRPIVFSSLFCETCQS